MTTTGQPFVLSLNAESRNVQGSTERTIKGNYLPPLPRGKTVVVGGQSIDESWIQRVLDEVPHLLPIDNIDERIEPPLISFGTRNRHTLRANR